MGTARRNSFPEACVDAHLVLAQTYGATLRYDEPVVSWRVTAMGCALVTGQGEYRARQLLLTAGGWIASLVPELSLPFSVERQVVVARFEPRARPERCFAPARCPIHLWEVAPQNFFYGFPDLGSGVKVARHHAGEVADPDHIRREVATRSLRRYANWCGGFCPTRMAHCVRRRLCTCTNAPDEHFWIDRHPEQPRVMIASPCSGHGFKFSSVIGEALAELLISGQSRFDLSLFRKR